MSLACAGGATAGCALDGVHPDARRFSSETGGIRMRQVRLGFVSRLVLGFLSLDRGDR